MGKSYSSGRQYCGPECDMDSKHALASKSGSKHASKSGHGQQTHASKSGVWSKFFQSQTLQELPMLSRVILNCQVTMIVMNSVSKLYEMSTISHEFTSHVLMPLSFLCRGFKGYKSLRSPFEGVL